MSPEALKTMIRVPERNRAAPRVISRQSEDRAAFEVERLVFDIAGMPVRGLLTRPAGVRQRLPAVLYCHAHGARYDIGAAELLDGRPALLSPWGPLLAAHGFVTLCIDVATFGERSELKEDALSKALLWRGDTLMGQMLADLLAAFDHLASRDDVDPQRIAAFGLSMGATHAYFLAAIEPRIARVAHLCCFADLAALVETGAHDLHGHYMTMPGLLAATSFGRIAGMAAPRPQLICIGEDDPLTPPLAVDRAFAETQAAYAAAAAEEELALLREPGCGHAETPRMRAAVLAFLDAMR